MEQHESSNGHRLSAGVARRRITPPTGVFLVGYGDRWRGNRGVHDEVWATALFLSDGASRVAIVSVDLLTVNEVTVDRIRAAVGDIEVLICCTHTHSGPISYADDRSRRRDRRYVDLLVDHIAAAVRAAARVATPARLEWSEGHADVASNRRERTADGRIEIGVNPDGPCDRTVRVLGVRTVDGERRIATVVGFACHATTLGPQNLLVSADWIGPMRDRLEADLGGLVLSVQGAGANINPLVSWDVPDQFASAVEVGTRVADAVIASVQAGPAPLAGTPVAFAREDVWIPTLAAVEGTEPPASYVAPLLSLAGLPAFAAPLGEPLLRRRYPWRPTIAAVDDRWAVPLRVGALRLGGFALVAFGAETFSEIGTAVIAASPVPATMFASVTDGSISYLATAEAHAEGGYEVDVAPWAYRYPGRLDPSGEQRAVAAADRLFDRLWNRSSVPG
ncbi:MAG: neutral/alkaline non-lysosomal ceramidase N-terminal domain-containing protein [Actinomycetota bacterium]